MCAVVAERSSKLSRFEGMFRIVGLHTADNLTLRYLPRDFARSNLGASMSPFSRPGRLPPSIPLRSQGLGWARGGGGIQLSCFHPQGLFSLGPRPPEAVHLFFSPPGRRRHVLAMESRSGSRKEPTMTSGRCSRLGSKQPQGMESSIPPKWITLPNKVAVRNRIPAIPKGSHLWNAVPVCL